MAGRKATSGSAPTSTIVAALERRGRSLPMPGSAPEERLDWESWWLAAAGDTTLAPLVAQRNERFGGRTHPPEFSPPIAWHVAALRRAGFAEAGCLWRRGEAAVLAALR